MVCQACGAPVVESVHFCSKCGAQVTPAQPTYAAYPPPPMPMYLPRVQRNLQTLGILWCVLGVYRVVSGLIGMIFLRALATHNFGDDAWMFGGRWHGPFAPMWMGGLWPVVAVATVFTAALALIAGFGLLNRRPWGQDRGNHRCDSRAAQISLWYGAWDLYALGAGAGGVGARV